MTFLSKLFSAVTQKTIRLNLLFVRTFITVIRLVTDAMPYSTPRPPFRDIACQALLRPKAPLAQPYVYVGGRLLPFLQYIAIVGQATLLAM